MAQAARILIVEDEAIEALDIQQRLEGMGHRVVGIAHSGEQGVELAEATLPDLMLLDIMLPGRLDGVMVAEQVRASLDIPVIYITAYADENTLQRAKVTEPGAYLVKPFQERELQIAIEMALYKHQTEKKLRDSEAWLSTTLRSISDAVIATDEKGLIKFMNPVAEGLTGWTLAEAGGKAPPEIFSIVRHDTGQAAEDPVARVLREGKATGLAGGLLVARGGSRTPVEDSAAPIIDQKGAVIGAVLVLRDISARKRTEVRLRSRERLATIGQFSGGVAHELRNPLATIDSSVYILEKRMPEGDEMFARHVKRIRDNVRRCVNIIDSLLNLTRNREPVVTPVNLKDLVEKAVAEYCPETIEVARDFPDLEYLVLGDRSQISMAIGNLLINAVQAIGEKGRLTLALHTNTQMMELAVTDSGPGISAENLTRIFEPLYTTKSKGIGLGLTIARMFIEKNCGTISVSSEEGHGATFVIKLPAGLERNSPDQASEGPAGSPAPPSARKRRKVLVVDDNRDFCENIKETLEATDYQAACAFDGLQSIEMVKAEPPDVMLLDVKMPGLDGVATLKRVKKIRPGIKVIMMTGHPVEEMIQEAIREGAVAALNKPFDFRKLQELIENGG